MFCKTIILSNSNSSTSNAPKGILTLSKESNFVKGKIRLYNLISLPASTKIGLYIDEKVHTSPLVKKPNHYEFDLKENIDITQSVYCALIDTSSVDKKVLLEGGSFNGFYFTDSPFDAILESKDEELEQTIDNALKQSENCEQCNCADCEYKKYFYQNYPNINNQTTNCDREEELNIDSCNSTNDIKADDGLNDIHELDTSLKIDDTIDNIQNKVVDKLENELIEEIKEVSSNILETNTPSINNSSSNSEVITNQDETPPSSQTSFLNDIIYQLDEMFTRYPEDEVLKSIIPNSRFVHVDANPPYVLGVIYEDKMMKYIAYGVPATYNSLPPSDLGQHYQWLPLNPNDVMSDGYFMIFQDALNGTLVEINFEE